MYQKPLAPSTEIKQAIIALAAQPDIHSISCPFTDFDLWEALLAEQVRRANTSGLPLQEAFCLMGPDCGIPGITTEPLAWEPDEHHAVRPDPISSGYAPHRWGGEIHIPYQGACDADLFILPAWHNTFPEALTKPNAKLGWLVRRECNHVLVPKDLGDFSCATKTHIAGWVLYTTKAPFEDCNPNNVSHRRMEELKARRRSMLYTVSSQLTVIQGPSLSIHRSHQSAIDAALALIQQALDQMDDLVNVVEWFDLAGDQIDSPYTALQSKDKAVLDDMISQVSDHLKAAGLGFLDVQQHTNLFALYDDVSLEEFIQRDTRNRFIELRDEYEALLRQINKDLLESI